MNNNSRLANFFIIPLILCILDTSLFFLFDYESIYLLCGWSVITIYYKYTWATILYLGTLLTLESFIFYGILGLPLLYFIPIIGIIGITRTALYQNKIYPLVLTLTCILCQTIGIEWYILGIPLNPIYTIGKIIATIIMTYIFSLKQDFAGQNRTTAHT